MQPPRIYDMFGEELNVGDKVIYTTSSKWTMLVHAEVTRIYEDNYKTMKVQVRAVVEDSAYKAPVSTVEYSSRKFYKL